MTIFTGMNETVPSDMPIVSDRERKARICIVQDGRGVISETFSAAHARHLPGICTVIHHGPGGFPRIDGRPVLSQAIPLRAFRKMGRILRGRDWYWECSAAYLKTFRETQAEAVLAQFGPVGVKVMEACRRARLPLIVYFRGYDASNREVLSKYKPRYQALFKQAAAIFAVSRQIKSRLIDMGAPEEKVFWNPSGVDCELFRVTDPAKQGPVFLAVGRFIEKKAPNLTLSAFAEVRRQLPEARLRMIGGGPLLDSCRQLVRQLGIEDAVTFLGPQSHDIVADEMRQARAFVQHSMEAANGDCEGTPGAVMEAGASGLPVIATRHAGIPDVVIDGETGYLVEEGDLGGMADRMLAVAVDQMLARRLGRAARIRIEATFSMERSIGRLWHVIESCISGEAVQLPEALKIHFGDEPSSSPGKPYP